MEGESKKLEREIFKICYRYNGMSLTEAWNLSYQQRLIAVQELQEISDSIKEARSGKKTIRASDIDNRY